MTMESVTREGELPPLTAETLDQEIASIREDILNWNCGHPMDLAVDRRQQI